jgi:hypothetical protein
LEKFDLNQISIESAGLAASAKSNRYTILSRSHFIAVDFIAVDKAIERRAARKLFF